MASITINVSDRLKHNMDLISNINWSEETTKFLENKVEEIFIKERFKNSLEEIKNGNFKSQREVEKMFLENEF